MTKDVDIPGRRGIAVTAELLSVLFVYSILTLVLYGHTFGIPFGTDDFCWIGGRIVGNRWKLTEHFILHWICPLLFGDNLAAYRLPSLILHAVNAVLVYQFFLLLFGEIKNSVGHSPLRLRVGGFVAGILFLFYDSGSPGWISQLCYQLVVTFSLSMFIFGLLYLRTGRSLCWIAVTLSYGIALLSHSFSLALPLFLIILEAGWRRKRDCRFNSAGMALRYGALGIPLAAFLGRYGEGIARGGDMLGPEWLGSALHHFPQYLWLAVLRFWPGNLVPDSVVVLPVAAALIVVCGICALGIRELFLKDKAMGIAGVFTLFLVCWNGLVFLQITAIEASFFGWWRYYFHAVGFSIAASYAIIRAAGIVSQAIRWLPEKILPMIIVVGLPVGILMGNSAVRYQFTRLGELRSGNRLFQPLFVRGDDEECREIEAMTQDQARSNLESTRDLRCRRLRRIDLQGLDLSDVDLSGSDLTHADLSGCNLTGARLEGSFLVGAVLEGADLRGAVLERANLSGADLRGVDLHGAVLNEALLHGVVLRGKDVRHIELKRAKMGGADLAGVDLRGADLRWANLDWALMAGADLREAVLEGVNWGNGADLSGADLAGASMKWATLSKANLKGADLSGADLSSAELRGSRLKGAILKGANLNGADLSDVDLSGSDLSDADLTGANLNRTILVDAKLKGALLRRVDLRQTDLTETQLEDAVLDGIRMKGAIYYPSASDP